MIQFRQMLPEEFEQFAQWSVNDYADDLIKSGNETAEGAFAASQNEFNEMLPSGLNSLDNYLYVIQNECFVDVGMIWYQKHMQKPTVAFICEFIINKEYRQRGYGKDTLLKIAEDAKDKGFKAMGLNVFKFNQIAYNLYIACGYQVVEDYEGNVIMEKPLG